MTPGQNLGRVFNSRSDCTHAMQLHFSDTKQPNLNAKTWPKQLLGSLLLDIALPAAANDIKPFLSEIYKFSY